MLKGRIKTGDYVRIIVGDNLSATIANVSTAGSPGRSQLHLYRLPLDQDNTTRGAEPVAVLPPGKVMHIGSGDDESIGALAVNGPVSYEMG
jgi:hypothetical protein